MLFAGNKIKKTVRSGLQGTYHDIQGQEIHKAIKMVQICTEQYSETHMRHIKVAESRKMDIFEDREKDRKWDC